MKTNTDHTWTADEVFQFVQENIDGLGDQLSLLPLPRHWCGCTFIVATNADESTARLHGDDCPWIRFKVAANQLAASISDSLKRVQANS